MVIARGGTSAMAGQRVCMCECRPGCASVSRDGLLDDRLVGQRAWMCEAEGVLSEVTILRLRDDLLAAGFTLDAVTRRLGATALTALGRNQTAAAVDALGTADDAQATLIRLWVLGHPVRGRDAQAALATLQALEAAGLVRPGADDADDTVQASVELKPYGWGDASGWVCCDRTPLDGCVYPPRDDHVLGPSPASTTLAQLTVRRPVGRALDLGTGSGVQSLHLSDHAERIVATDVNPRALALARITLGLSGVTAELRSGSLYDPVSCPDDPGSSAGLTGSSAGPTGSLAGLPGSLAGLAGPTGSLADLPGSLPSPLGETKVRRRSEDGRPHPHSGEPADGRFDLIVTNPPYVMAPPAESHLTYREGGFASDGLMRAVIAGAPEHLRPGGLLQVVGNWAITPGEPWPERLAAWIRPTGCDAIVLARETLDIYEYIEIWLADAGLTGTPGYAAAYRRWLDYFAEQHIVGVGMGWLSLCRAEREIPEIRQEDWPHAVAQPVGEAVGNFFDAVDAARLDDAQILGARLAIRDDVIEETIGRPGAPDPEHIVFRQTSGLCRAVTADTALAAVLGACDGELPLGALIAATATLTDADAQKLRDELLPRMRDLLLDGFVEAPK